MPEARLHDSDFGNQIGNRVKQLRQRLNLTREELASRVFLDESDVREIEAGYSSVPLAVLRRVAEALGIDPRELLSPDVTPDFWSVFISYGGPDADIARRFYDWLRSRGVHCFFFPESATPGVRLHRSMSEGVREYDRILLLCSQHSLNRTGVLFEIEQVLLREAEEGGTELLVPVVLDNYMFAEWQPSRPDAARQVRARVVADFRDTLSERELFDRQMNRLLRALRRD